MHFLFLLFSVGVWSSEGFFQSSRGLRQGDPLLAFLFNVVMEVLYRLVSMVELLRLFHGCRVGADELSIPLIQYADDYLFLLWVLTDQVNLYC